MNRWQWMVASLVVAASCGGGGSGDATATTAASDAPATRGAGRTIVTIDDVVVTLDVPEGAVPAGTEIDIGVGDVPPGLAQVGDVTVHAFDLEPSGLEFLEPVTITFRMAAPGDAGTPLVFVLIESEGGATTVLPSEATRQGDEVLVSALVEHFSQAYLVLPDGTEVILTPELLHMRLGESGRSETKFREGQEVSFTSFSPGHDYFYEAYFEHNVLPVASGFISLSPESTWTEVTCLKETNGVIENAYEEIVEDREPNHAWMDGITGRLAGAGSASRIRLLGDVRCDPAPDTTTTSTTTTTEPPSGSDPEGDQEDGNTSEEVEEGEGEPGGDITNVSHVLGDEGEHCFIIAVAGDGETLAADAPNYLIDIEVVDPEGEGGGWGANVQFRRGTLDAWTVRLGELAPGRDRLEGADLSVEWTDRDTMKVTVAGAGTGLGVEGFDISIGVFTSDGIFFDHATGVGEP